MSLRRARAAGSPPEPTPPAVTRPAPAMRAVAALAALELRLAARRGENVLVTLVIPVAVLLFFAGTNVAPGLGDDRLAILVPGTIALAIIAAGLVNLGIATAYERSYGVLKRLGGAPLPRWGVLVAKMLAVLAIELLQVAVVLVLATTVLGWRPGAGWSAGLFIGALGLGTVAFAGLGLLLAGTLRAEATLALANGLFVALLMLGGIVVPVSELPGFLQPVAAVLPATALADLLGIALNGATATTSPAVPALVLLLWGVGAVALAARRFRWD